MKRRDFLQLGGLTAAGAGVVVTGCAPPVSPGSGGGDLLDTIWPADQRRRLVVVAPRNPSDPPTLAPAGSKSVLVVGGGVAGLSAALELVERGYAVTVREAAPEFGGRLATRELDPGVGATFRVEHGLHMWFDNYRVFGDIRRRLGIDHHFRPYDAVDFVFRDYLPERLESTPKVFPLNLLGIIDRSPNLDIGDVFESLGILDDVLGFRIRGLYDRLDDMTFFEWTEKVKVGSGFHDVIMQPAASVTLNDQSALSAAEMVMYQHLYFTSQPYAFDREVTTSDHGTAVIDPWVAHLRAKGATVISSAPVPGLEFDGDRAVGIVGEPGTFDWVVLACDVTGIQRLAESSTGLNARGSESATSLGRLVAPLEIAPPYRILRVWLDSRPDDSRPDVIETPQHEPLTLIAQFDRLEDESRQWAESSGGCVLEFHLYAVDAELAAVPDADLWGAIRPTVLDVLPELESASVAGYTVGNYENFSAFTAGSAKYRPDVRGAQSAGLSNVVLAGDWVAASVPSALMERSVLTGRLAANECLVVDGVREASYQHVSGLGPTA